MAACLNAASLALIDAGVPMSSIMAAVTSGSIAAADETNAKPEPILDINNSEEQELPFLSIATVTGSQEVEDNVSVLMMESKIQLAGPHKTLESMLAVGLDGCKQVRKLMEGIIRQHAAKTLESKR